MTQTFEVEQLPTHNDFIKANRAGKYKGARMKKDYTDMCHIIAKIAGVMVTERSSFTFAWHEPNKRRDPDNICFAKKFILDGLVQGEMMSTDGWKVVGELKDIFIHEKTLKHPCVKVSITPMVETIPESSAALPDQTSCCSGT